VQEPDSTQLSARPAPEGFARHFRQSPLTDPWEPLYSRRDGEAVVIGLWSGKRHGNSRGFVHGGLVAALADNAMGLSCAVNLPDRERLVTVGLSIDFLGTARLDQWIEFRTTLLKVRTTLCFAQCLVTADTDLCARANATFRVIRRESVPE
jgi:uncharacterized protein (TIGR00369 family)